MKTSETLVMNREKGFMKILNDREVVSRWMGPAHDGRLLLEFEIVSLFAIEESLARESYNLIEFIPALLLYN